MGFIDIGNASISNIALGNAQVIGVWVGNVFVWPENIYDCDNKLLDEWEHGFKGVIGGKSEEGEKLFQVDRHYWPHESEYEGIVTDSADISKVNFLEYEEGNNYPYEGICISRDYVQPHFDDKALLVTYDGSEQFIHYDDPHHHFFTAYLGIDPAGEDISDD